MYLITIILTVLVLLSPALFPKPGEIIYGGDLLTQFYYWKDFLADNLRLGIIPFWNPYNFSGTPFLAHPSTAFFYPATLLYLLFPLNLAFSLNYLLHLIIGGLGIFYLSRRYSDNLVALISSIAFILSGYVSSRIYAGHVDLLTTSVWIPWLIYSFLSVSDNPKKKKNIISAVIFLVLLILAGYSAYLIFCLEFIFLLLIYRSLLRPKKTLNYLISFFLIITIAVGISAVQWLPTWQLTKNSIRGRGLPYELASWGSLPLTGLKLFLNPFDRDELNKISFNLGGGPLPNPFDHFPGRIVAVIPLLFIAYFILNYLITGKKNKLTVNSDFWFFLFTCLFFLWLSFGNSIRLSLHHLLYQLIPFHRYIRIPIQNLIIPVVLIPVMAGMVLSKIRIVLPKVIIGIALTAELLLFSRQYIFLTLTPEQKHDKSIIKEILNNPDNTRLLPAFRVISPILDRFDLNSAMFYRFETTSGYDPVILKDYYDFIDMSNGNKISSLTYFNVEIPPIDLAKNTASILNVGRILSGDGKVIRNNSFLPRFYFKENPDCRDENKRIELIEYSLNKIILKTQNRCKTELLSSEVYFPGWQAKIGGKYTQIFRTNTAFRAINLPEGIQTIEYYYFPIIYFFGFMISISSLVVGFILLNKYHEQ